MVWQRRTAGRKGEIKKQTTWQACQTERRKKQTGIRYSNGEDVKKRHYEEKEKTNIKRC